jgi:hypothetical protein
MAIEVRELYHFAISASAVDPDLAVFVQESGIFEITGSNTANTVDTSAAYVVELEGFRIEGQAENRPVVYKSVWYEIEGQAEDRPSIIATGISQIEGSAPNRPSVIRTALFQITS